MNLIAATSAPTADLPRAGHAVLLVGSTGFLFANFTAQLLSAHFGVHSVPGLSTGGNAWATAVFTVASFAGVVTAQPLEQRMGIRLYFVAAALLLAAFGWLQAMVPSEAGLVSMRGFEGFASGSFGPRALLAAFLFYRGGRLSMTMALVALFLLVAGVIGFVMFGASASGLGRSGLFLVQCVLGVLMALAGLRWLPSIARTVPCQPGKTFAAPAIRRPVGSSRRHRRGQRHATASASRSRIGIA